MGVRRADTGAQIYAGQHETIVDRALWDQVQETLTGNAKDRSDGKDSAHPSPLGGFLFDDRGNRLTPSHTQRGSVRYRYYVCQALLQHESEKAGPIKRVPAAEIESLIAGKVCEMLKKPSRLVGHLVGDDAASETKEAVISAAAKVEGRLNRAGERHQLSFARIVISRIIAGVDTVKITFNSDALKVQLGLIGVNTDTGSHTQAVSGKAGGNFTVIVAVRLTRSGRQKRMIIADDNGEQRLVNEDVVMAIARAIKWDPEIRSGNSIRQIAKRENLSPGYVSRVMPLAFLAPDIVQAIYEGRQSSELKVKALSANLPIEWAEQRRVLGFPAR